ncbi:MAG: chemotaxis protein CheD [Elusimicrobiaceae bacterium]|nr:chemotaxis protein CheD [Elusimicrobiaceae bacterium]
MPDHNFKCEHAPQPDEGNKLTVGMADIKIAAAPKVLQTTLGSCIAICAYSRAAKTGGMLHFMMPGVLASLERQGLKEAKYAVTGIPKLFNLLMARGIRPEELEVKLFGGGRILKNVSRDIGTENCAAAELLLAGRGLTILPGRTGGEKGLRLEFELESGIVKCRAIDEKITEDY